MSKTGPFLTDLSNYRFQPVDEATIRWAWERCRDGGSRRIRLNAGLSLNAMAGLLNAEPWHGRPVGGLISQWERGITTPQPPYALRYGQVLMSIEDAEVAT